MSVMTIFFTQLLLSLLENEWPRAFYLEGSFRQ